MSTKRLKRRAHPREPKQTDRFSLVPLSFIEALKEAEAANPKRGPDQGKGTSDKSDDV